MNTNELKLDEYLAGNAVGERIKERARPESTLDSDPKQERVQVGLNFVTHILFQVTCANCSYIWKHRLRTRESYRKIIDGKKQWTLCQSCRVQCKIKQGLDKQ